MHPLVIGHAAAAGEAPANTLAGVRSALASGAEAMEIDVQLSADGVPVLMHDTTVDRTTSLRGSVRDYTFAELQATDAGEGEPVPSLGQVLELVAGRLTVMCELKATPGHADQDEALVDGVLAVIRVHEARSWAAIHSFSPDIVARSRATDPGLSAAIISPAVRGPRLERLLGATLKRNAQAVSVHHECVDRAAVLAAKRRQLCIWAWTADTPADWQRLADAGVDGIITNVPHQLRAFLG
ncbi:MAG: hypothetical protein M0R74_07685 [Dehalococcoidia bacterium]|nr:hypothetical protein [Dehalococcoidia bacterium]